MAQRRTFLALYSCSGGAAGGVLTTFSATVITAHPLFFSQYRQTLFVSDPPPVIYTVSVHSILGGLVMHHYLTNQIIEKIQTCDDESLLDLILKLLLESGY
jgi:hypothetical protein